jgi:hypothetical protein
VRRFRLDPGVREKIQRMFKRIPEQIRRLAIVFAFVIGGVVVFRYFILPPSLMEPRLHRESTVQREVAKKIKFAGTTVCGECHEDIAGVKQKGFHKNLACETCHGPAEIHTEDPLTTKPFAPRRRKFCPLCHKYDPSRPTGFPQINVTIHNPLKPCVTCHNPHDPKPPTIPSKCSACHAEIARTKAVSHHALISCTTCHRAPRRHRQNPRRVKPTKPNSREFCGKCHREGSKRRDAPKIDLATHGGRYMCWECHYPHLPGGA